MIAQRAHEVIVVDYSCPEGTGAFVAEHFPSVRVVPVAGQEHFSNWKARNAGAAVATGDVLVFVDADTILADGAIEWLSEQLPERTYGFFDSKTSRSFNQDGLRLASNQLKGFHAIPTAAFRRAGGYDAVLEGYAAGADTDLEERLTLIRFVRHPLDLANHRFGHSARCSEPSPAPRLSGAHQLCRGTALSRREAGASGDERQSRASAENERESLCGGQKGGERARVGARQSEHERDRRQAAGADAAPARL